MNLNSIEKTTKCFNGIDNGEVLLVESGGDFTVLTVDTGNAVIRIQMHGSIEGLNSLGEVNLAVLQKALKAAPKNTKDVDISVKHPFNPKRKQNDAVASGALQVDFGKRTASIPYTGASDYSLLQPGAAVSERSRSVLSGIVWALDYTVPVRSTDETREHLQTVLHEASEVASMAKFVATDGHRLHIVETPHLTSGTFFLTPDMIRFLYNVQKAFGDEIYLIETELYENVVEFSFTGSVECSAQFILSPIDAAKYPDYRQVMPSGNDVEEVELVSSELAETLRTFQKVLGKGCKVSLNGVPNGVQATATDEDVTLDDQLGAVEPFEPSKPCVVLVRSHYVNQAMIGAQETTKLRIPHDPCAPLVVETAPSKLAVVMPNRPE